MFQVSRPYLGFCPDPKHFIVNCEQNIIKYANMLENGAGEVGRGGGVNVLKNAIFHIKYFDKTKW